MQRPNHRGVPKDGCDVRDEEKAVAIKNAKTPCGENKQPHSGKHDLDKVNGQFALIAVKKPGGDQIHHVGRDKDAKEDDCTLTAERQQAGNDAGNTAGEFGFAFGEETGIDGDEGSGEDAFAEEILEEIGDLERGAECVGGIGEAKVVAEDAGAEETGEPAEEDAGADEERWRREDGTGSPVEAQAELRLVRYLPSTVLQVHSSERTTARGKSEWAPYTLPYRSAWDPGLQARPLRGRTRLCSGDLDEPPRIPPPARAR